MCTQDEVDPGTEKARKELEERLEEKESRKERDRRKDWKNSVPKNRSRKNGNII